MTTSTGRRARTRTTAITTMTATLALSVPASALPGAQATDARPPSGAGDSSTTTSLRGLVSGIPPTLTTGSVPITDRPGLLRTPDGVLHVSYTRQTSPGHVQAAHVAVSPAGRVVRRSDITAPWMFLTASAIVPAPGGMRVLLNGYTPDAPTPFAWGGAYSALGDGAGAWTVPAERLNRFDGESDLATLPDGSPLSAVLHWSGMHAHVGAFTQDNTGAPSHQQVAGGGGYNLNLERVGDEVYVGWNVLAGSGSPGTFVQRVHPTLGPVLAAPGSSGSADAVGSSNRSALAVSTTGHLYSAYCAGGTELACDHISLWNVSTGHVTRVPRSGGATRAITLSAAPEGRMWITWRSAPAELTGVRTNRTGTAVGTPTVRPLGDAFGFPHSAAESSLGFADVVLTVSGKHVLARLLPALSVSASPRRWGVGRAQRLTFRVVDAGEAVGGARVRLAGKSCRTSAAGRCSVRLRPSAGPRRLTAKISATGYDASAVLLRIKR